MKPTSLRTLAICLAGAAVLLAPALPTLAQSPFGLLSPFALVSLSVAGVVYAACLAVAIRIYRAMRQSSVQKQASTLAALSVLLPMAMVALVLGPSALYAGWYLGTVSAPFAAYLVTFHKYALHCIDSTFLSQFWPLAPLAVAVSCLGAAKMQAPHPGNVRNAA